MINKEQKPPFEPITLEQLTKVLGLTIKRDDENKIATFLCQLSAYTKDSQFNISFNAPSSTGKSYIPTEIARLFPKEDVIELAYCSPTAFFHDAGEFNKEIGGYEVELGRKILIFLDQPHNELLARLRPLLSHDEPEIHIKITDKSQKHGLKAKNVVIRGYPSVIFCTAGLRIDEQEATRFLLLSPEIHQEKIREAVIQAIKKESNSEDYGRDLRINQERNLLKDRILWIRDAGIEDIIVPQAEEVERRFLENHKMLKPRHQRDVKRLMAIIKSLALLNLWFREHSGTTISASKEDVDAGFTLWEKLSVSQELNLPPYIYNLYQDVIYAEWLEANNSTPENPPNLVGSIGITRQAILRRHYSVYDRMLDVHKLRQEIIPMLETAGLISQEPDQNDKRKLLVYPTSFGKDENNSENRGGISEINISEIPF